MRTGILGMSIVLAVMGTTPANADEPSATDLMKLAPVVRSTDPDIKSIEMVGTMKQGLHLKFRAVYKAPDHYSLLVSDGSDQTPLVFVADRQLLCYDPIRSSVLCLKGCSEQLSLEADPKAAKFLFGFIPDGKQGHAQNVLNIDLQAICAKLGQPDQIQKTGETRYRVFLTKDRSATVCIFDVSKPQPFESLTCYDGLSHEPVLTIEKLVVNGKLSDDEFRFPDRERLARKIKINEMVGDGFEPAEVEVKKITTAMMARLGATHPGLRESLKEPAFKQIDWNAVKHRDRKLSAILRDLVPVDRHSTADKKPASSPLAGVGGSTRR